MSQSPLAARVKPFVTQGAARPLNARKPSRVSQSNNWGERVEKVQFCSTHCACRGVAGIWFFSGILFWNCSVRDGDIFAQKSQGDQTQKLCAANIPHPEQSPGQNNTAHDAKWTTAWRLGKGCWRLDAQNLKILLTNATCLRILKLFTNRTASLSCLRRLFTSLLSNLLQV